MKKVIQKITEFRKRLKLTSLLRRSKGMRRASFILAMVVAFVTTYYLVLPALTLDLDTATDEPGISVASSEDGDSDSGSDESESSRDSSDESDSSSSESGSDESSDEGRDASNEEGESKGGDTGSSGESSGSGSEGEDASAESGQTDPESGEENAEGSGEESTDAADGSETGNTGSADGSAQDGTGTDGTGAGGTDGTGTDGTSAEGADGTGTDGTGAEGTDAEGTLSDPTGIAAGAGLENSEGDSVTGAGMKEEDDSDLTELESRVKDILLRVDAEEGVLEDGVNLKAKSLDSDDVLKAARDAGIIGDEDTEEKNSQKSRVCFGFSLSFRDAEDYRCELPEEVTVSAWRDNDKTEEYLDEDHTSTPGQRLDEFVKVFRDYADGDRDALNGYHMIFLYGGDAEKANELGYEENALCMRADRDMGFAVIYTEEEPMPAQSFEGELDDIRVSVEAPKGALPRGTTMELTPVESEEILAKVQDAVNTDEVRVKTVQAVDITFYDKDGNEIEPAKGSAVKVSMFSEKIAENESSTVVHVDNDGQAAAMDEATVKGETVEFETDQFSVYAIVGTETLTGGFVSADGSTYEVTVTYGPGAEIPDGSTLKLVELEEESEAYQKAKESIDLINDEARTENAETDEGASGTEETHEEASGTGENTLDESEDDAYFSSITEENKIVKGFSALDISIQDPQGNVIEPKGEVTVSIVMKSLPDGMNAAELADNLEVHHIVEKDGQITPEQVAGAAVEGSDITADKNGAEIEFVTDSFSTYTISWQNGSHNVRLHFVDDEGNEIDGFTYNGQPIDNGSTSLAALIPQNGLFDLSQFKKEGYSLSNTHVGQFADMNENTPTIIRNVIEKADTNLRYWTFNTGNDTAGTTRRDFPTGTTDLYLVYNSTIMKGQGGSGSGSGGEVPDLGVIGNKKEAESNNDGTYKLSLSVTGNAQNKHKDPHVNVIVVFDTSSSMVSHTIPGSNRITRLEAAKDEINLLAAELLAYDTAAHPDAVEMALVTFNRNASIVSFGGSNWTTSADAFTRAVGTYRNGPVVNNNDGSAGNQNTGVPTAKGTNWAQGMQKAADLMGHDTDPTYVLFITDGAPSQYWPSGVATGTYADAEGCYLGARDEARRLVAEDGDILYGLFAYGSTDDYSKDYLGSLVNYAYNSDSAAAAYRFNAADNETFNQKLKEILRTINMNFAYANVEIDDGITELSTVVFEHFDTESFAYKITYRNYTSTTQYTEEVLEIEPNEDGTVTIPGKTYGVLDRSAPGGVRTVTTQEVTLKGAQFIKSEDKSVVWDLEKATGEGNAAIYMLEDGWTYTVSFDVWPSQTSYDLVAALNNHVINYGDDYHYTDESDDSNHTITFEEYKDQITNTQPYTLLTNTHARVKYQQVTEVEDDDGNITFEYGEEKTVPITYTSNMGLVSQRMPVKKEFAHSINAQDPYTQIRFYLMVDGYYYQSDGTLSTELVPYTGSGESITPALHTIGMDLSSANSWTGNIYISPGLIVDERESGGEAQVLETGHMYSLHEVITEGNVYEYEFTPQIVRPMVVNGNLKFLVKQDKYNVPASGAKTYSIDGDTYYEAPADAQALVGTNRKTAELDITKIITDPDDLMTEAEENAQTFTYRVTLRIPDQYPNGTPVDPAGIVGYEYVPRTQSNAFILYGYQSTDTDHGFDEDVARFSGKTYRGWNTLVYRDLTQWANVDGRIVSLKDENGNVLWKIPAVDGYHEITYDMTLKQDEVIRFTNLPSGTIYTVQELYANKYPADNAGGITSGRPPISDSGNIADEGYVIADVKHTGGTVDGDTVTGTIDKLDARFYNQFTNTVRSNNEVRAELKVKKVTEYQWPTNQYYRFTLAPGTAAYADGTTGTSPMPDGTANSVREVYDNDTTPNHTASFGTILYTKAGTYTYTVTEAWAPAFAQKPEAAAITVTVESLDGRLVVTNIEDNLGTTEYTPAGDTNLAEGLTTQTNKYKTIDVSANKIWLKADGETVLDTPPAGSKVVFTLYENGEPTDQSVELDGTVDQNGELFAWAAVFSNLPQYTVTQVETETGYTSEYSEINYTIAETSLSDGFVQVTAEPVADKGEIKNKLLAREVRIQKRRQDGSTPLNGAIFDLYTKAGYESNPKAAPVKTDMKSETIGGIDGVIELGELPYGDYYLVETAAPNGYNRLTEAIALTVGADETNGISIMQGGTLRKDDNPDDTDYKAFITNDEGVALPHTGGPGTLPYTSGGLMLVIISALMYGFRRRRREGIYN